MSTPLQTTELHIPLLRPNLVPRLRLIERLNAGLPGQRGFARRLTPVSAPAGSGETTLVTEWLAGASQCGGCEHPFTWLSLDEGDNNPDRFFTYLLAALQRHDPRSNVPWMTTGWV